MDNMTIMGEGLVGCETWFLPYPLISSTSDASGKYIIVLPNLIFVLLAKKNNWKSGKKKT